MPSSVLSARDTTESKASCLHETRMLVKWHYSSNTDISASLQSMICALQESITAAPDQAGQWEGRNSLGELEGGRGFGDTDAQDDRQAWWGAAGVTSTRRGSRWTE